VFLSAARLQKHVEKGKHAYTNKAFEVDYTYQKNATQKRAAWHSRTSSEFVGRTTKDVLKIKTAQLLDHSLNTGSLVNLTELSAQTESTLKYPQGVKWALFDGSEVSPYDPEFEYARIRRSQNKNVVLSGSQLEFILFVQGRGDKTAGEGAGGNTKTMPRTAEEAMRLAGTAAGQAMFPGEKYMVATPNGARRFRCEDWLDAQQLKSQMSKPRKQLLSQYEKTTVKEAETGNKQVLKMATKAQIQQLILQHPYPFDPAAPPPKLADLRKWLATYAVKMRRSGTPVEYVLED